MKLVVISHKEVWPDRSSSSGFSTVGGFPFQMEAISEIFDETTILVPVRSTSPMSGLIPLVGHRLRIEPLPEPTGTNLRRKIAFVTWLPLQLPLLWNSVRYADAVHVPVPGDIGTIGILIALAQGKPLFVRHCGTWGRPLSKVDRVLQWLLCRIAGGRNVVLATGGGINPPSLQNDTIRWIFSTSLSHAEWASLPTADSWHNGIALRLITVGRLSRWKNVRASISAVRILLDQGVDVHLDVVGDGPELTNLLDLVAKHNISDRVVFHGNVAHEQVLALLTSAHLFVFPSFREGFPKAVLEAMACGLPVVATAVSVLPQLIGDQNGKLLAETHAEAVVEAVFQLASDPERLAAMGRSARQTAQAYTLERWQEEIRQALAEAWGQDAVNAPSL